MKKTFLLLFISLFLVSSVLGVGDYDVDIVSSSSDTSGNQGEIAEVLVNIKNSGNSYGDKKIECGIYDKDDLSKWYSDLSFSIIGNIGTVPNCMSQQSNVETKRVKLPPGQSSNIYFEVVVPSTDSSNDYAWLCQAFDYCDWETQLNGEDIGITGRDSLSFNVIGDKTLETCSDGVTNQDETSTDCGGSCGATCPLGFKCEVGSDCQSGNCISGVCSPKDAAPGDDDGSGSNNVTFILVGVGFVFLLFIWMVVLRK